MSNSDWEIIVNEISDTKANLYLTILKQEGLNAIMTNSSMATMIPMHDSGFIIRVPAKETAKARQILADFEMKLQNPKDEDFYDADLEDIDYEQSVNEYEQMVESAKGNQLWYLIIFIVILSALYLYIRFA